MTGVIHIAGQDVLVGSRLRQRCSWCGAMLIDIELSVVRHMVGECEEALNTSREAYPTWQVGELVIVDDNLQAIVAHSHGDQLPEGSCGLIDPEITV